MAAIALLESGGNPNATNPSGATGLWQVEFPLHNQDVPGITTAQQALDPNNNAKLAISILGGGGGLCSGWGTQAGGDAIGEAVCNSGSKPLSLSAAVSMAQHFAGASDAAVADAVNPTGLTGQALQVAEAALAGPLGLFAIGAASSAASSASSVFSSVTDVGSFVTAISADISSRAWWLRVGEWVLGASLVIGGLALFLATTKPGQDAISAGELAAVA